MTENCEHVWIEHIDVLLHHFHCKNCDRKKCRERKCNKEAIYSVDFVEYASTPLCEIHYPQAINDHIISITGIYNKNNQYVTELEDLLNGEKQQA